MAGSEAKIADAKLIPRCQDAAARLRFFLRFHTEIGGEPKLFVGDAAIAYLIAQLEAKEETQAATADEIKDLVTYKWLIPKEKRPIVAAAIKAVRARDKSASKLPTAAKRGTGAAAKKKDESLREQAQSFFN